MGQSTGINELLENTASIRTSLESEVQERKAAIHQVMSTFNNQQRAAFEESTTTVMGILDKEREETSQRVCQMHQRIGELQAKQKREEVINNRRSQESKDDHLAKLQESSHMLSERLEEMVRLFKQTVADERMDRQA